MTVGAIAVGVEVGGSVADGVGTAVGLAVEVRVGGDVAVDGARVLVTFGLEAVSVACTACSISCDTCLESGVFDPQATVTRTARHSITTLTDKLISMIRARPPITPTLATRPETSDR